jgi:hypothetical protein
MESFFSAVVVDVDVVVAEEKSISHLPASPRTAASGSRSPRSPPRSGWCGRIPPWRGRPGSPSRFSQKRRTVSLQRACMASIAGDLAASLPPQSLPSFSRPSSSLIGEILALEGIKRGSTMRWLLELICSRAWEGQRVKAPGFESESLEEQASEKKSTGGGSLVGEGGATSRFLSNPSRRSR